MLRKLVAILALVMLSACRRHSVLSGDHPAELVGTWQLLIRSSCRDYGLKADALILHADGTFDQHVALNDGKEVDLAAQHWHYSASDSGGHLTLDKRLEFFTPEYFGKRVGEGVGAFEVLLVELGSEPVIVLHPDSDCVYEKATGVH